MSRRPRKGYGARTLGVRLREGSGARPPRLRLRERYGARPPRLRLRERYGARPPRLRLRERYGARPLHLVAGLGTLAVSAYAILELFHRAKPLEIAEWLIAAIVLHDLILLPCYSLLAGLAQRGLGVGEAGRQKRLAALNHLRIAFFFVVLPLFVWAPLILGLANTRYAHNTGQTTDIYLGRWLLYAGVVCLGSAVLYAIRVRRTPACDPPPITDPEPAADPPDPATTA